MDIFIINKKNAIKSYNNNKYNFFRYRRLYQKMLSSGSAFTILQHKKKTMDMDEKIAKNKNQKIK